MRFLSLLTWGKRLAIAGILGLTALYLLAWVFEDRLGRLALDLIRDEVSTQVEVKGFNLSFIRAFPRIRGDFRDVYIQGTDGDTLLACRSLGLRMGWSALWSDELALDALTMESGLLRLRTDKSGKANYLIFPPSKDGEEQPVRFNLRKAGLSGISVRYLDDRDGTDVALAVDEATLHGKWTGNRIDLDEELNGTLVHVLSGRDTLVRTMPVVAEGPMHIDLDKMDFAVPSSDIRLAGFRTSLSGRWQIDANGTYYDLTFNADGQEIADLWALAGTQGISLPDRISPQGETALDLTIKGMARSGRLPAIKATLDWSDGQIRAGDDNLRNVRASLVWQTPLGGTLHQSWVTIDRFLASYAGEDFHVEGKITQPDDPILDLKAEGSLPVALIQTDQVSGQAGRIRFSEVTITGKPGRNDLQANGTANLEEVVLTYQGDEVSIPLGALALVGDRLDVRNLDVTIGGNRLRLDGHVRGFLSQFRDMTSPIPVGFDGHIISEDLDALALMEQFRTWQHGMAASQQAPAAGEDKPNPAFTVFEGKLQADLGKFRWDQVEGREFSGSVSVNGRSMLISGDADAMGGSFNLEGELQWGQKTTWQGALTCTEVDVKEAFRQCRDFGQTFITGRQISGALSTQLLFNAEWDSRGEFIPENLHVYAAIELEDGELVDLDVLKSFSDYIHVKDLEHVRFSTLRNYLEIVDGLIYLPQMTIRSNALVLDVTGKHGFNQSIDYGLRVDAGQVLINKITRHDPTLAPKPASRSGWFNLYYHLAGTVDDYTYKADRDRVKDDFARSPFHRDRIRSVLEAEFGRLLFDVDPLDETSPMAEHPLQVAGSAPSATAPSTTTGRALTESVKRALTSDRKPVSAAAGAKEDPYLDDFEIEGGAGKKKD